VEQSLRLNVLGAFEVRSSDGEAPQILSRKAQALLGFLAVENKRPHSREQLATLLWSAAGDERARHNLRQSLSKIRACCDSLLIASGDSLAINAQRCAVDIVEFERLSKSNDAVELGRCLELYGGDLLEGLVTRESAYEEWLMPARARYHRVACEVADQLIQLVDGQGKNEETIKALNQRLLLDPACEPAHAKLMELFARVGRRSDALRQYQACVEVLQRELGAEPSPETSSLYAEIRDSSSAVGKERTRHADSDGIRSVHERRPTVAVLPFDNLSGSEDAYFVDGIVEDLITALSRFDSLVVTARGSSFIYRERAIPDRQIAEELGAQFLVRGSLQRAGKRVRLNVQLLDAAAESHLWGARFDREFEDVFVLQDEITSTLVSTLAGQVEAARLASARRAAPERLDAYDILLRGKDHHHRYTAEDCRTCIDMFERAIERDPDYAVAHAWLACGLGQAIVFKLDETPKLVDRVEAAARRGLELDANESECHRLLAQVCMTRRNLKQSQWHQERALLLNPNDDRSVCSMGEILSFVGRHEEAEEWVRKSMKLNPYHPQRYWTHLARPLFHLGKYQAALDALGNISQLRIDDHTYRVAANARIGDAAALELACAELRDANPEFDSVTYVESLPYERSRDRQDILDALQLAGSRLSG
jgi:adenylate cyclase